MSKQRNTALFGRWYSLGLTSVAVKQTAQRPALFARLRDKGFKANQNRIVADDLNFIPGNNDIVASAE